MGELLSRFFDLKSQNLEYQRNADGYLSNKKNIKGRYVFGKPPVLFRTYFRYNDIGFNSKLDYKDYDDKKINIAFVGDSYVESFHVDNSDSFSSILMSKSNKIQSYDFGISGYNIVDYIFIYNKFNLEKFDFVFILIDKNDISNFGNRIKFNKQKIKVRDLYDASYFFNYLNSNHSIIPKLKKIFNRERYSTDLKNKVNLSTENFKFLTKQNIILIPRNYDSYLYFKNQNFNNLIKILNDKKPINFGAMNTHWNRIGRENVINSLIPKIENYIK